MHDFTMEKTVERPPLSYLLSRRRGRRPELAERGLQIAN